MRKQDKTAGGGDDKVFSATTPESDASLAAGKSDDSPKTNLLVLNEVRDSIHAETTVCFASVFHIF